MYNKDTDRIIYVERDFRNYYYIAYEDGYKLTPDMAYEEVTLYDSLKNIPVKLYKVYGKPGEEKHWEYLKGYERFLFDNKLVCGLDYNSDLTPRYKKIDIDPSLDNESKYWIKLLNQPVPHLRRLAIDIEVEYEENKIPNVLEATQRINAVGFSSNDGFRHCFVLGNGVDTDMVSFLETERELLEITFMMIKKYPIIITFNGDAFDLPYLNARADYLEIPNKPLRIQEGNSEFINPVMIKNAIHLDLYRFFKNPSIKNYAFSAKYNENSLNAVSKGVLNKKKLEFDFKNDKDNLEKMAQYCLNDTDLTLELTTFNDDLLIKLMIMICRLCKLPIDDICRYGINQWGRGVIYSDQIKKHILIPINEELAKKGTAASQQAIIKDKKFKGAYVHESTENILFNVVTADFASLYPSIIKVNNISYETVNCYHSKCKTNLIPETQNWICLKKQGVTSRIIGALRDLRVNYYKQMAKRDDIPENEKQQYDIIAQTLKVILNASYGIMGFESFPLYCLPAAEAITAFGRHIITTTIKEFEKNGIKVVYSDTDSVFLYDPDPEKLNEMISWIKNKFNIDIEKDKEYRYLIMTGRKKNYLGITKNGKLDIKGLVGKKSHTPLFIRELFYEILDILKRVNNPQELEESKKLISNIITMRIIDLKNGKIEMDKLSFTPTINKNLETYGKLKSYTRMLNLDGEIIDHEEYLGIPQHIKAAKLENAEIGSKIKFIKTRDREGVKSTHLVKSINEVDIEKYLEIIENTLGQILSALKIDFREIITPLKQNKLDIFF